MGCEYVQKEPRAENSVSYCWGLYQIGNFKRRAGGKNNSESDGKSGNSDAGANLSGIGE